jgi:hypothetical protein
MRVQLPMPSGAGVAGKSARAEYWRRWASAWLGWTTAAAAVAGYAAGITAGRLAPSIALVPVGIGVVVLLPWFAVTARRGRSAAGRWKRGARGEQGTRQILRRLEERIGCVVLDDLGIPGSQANTGRWWISD